MQLRMLDARTQRKMYSAAKLKFYKIPAAERIGKMNQDLIWSNPSGSWSFRKEANETSMHAANTVKSTTMTWDNEYDLSSRGLMPA